MLHAEISGSGRPVVLLHGLFGRGRNLAALGRGLAGSARVVALDLRNHGESPHAAGMDYKTLASDVLETLHRLDALPAALLGHSMGGKTAMACALMAPGSIERLLVADIAPVAYAHHNDAVAAAMRAIPLHAGTTRGEVGALLADAVPDAAVRGFLLQNFLPGAVPGWRIGLDDIADAMADIEAWPDFGANARFAGPVLFVNGGASDYVTEAGREAASALFPNAQYVTLENAGHWLHVDQPAAFMKAAEGFFH